jgi:ubiquinone/menaquinone biosynthesis C-methylase UbiE
MSHSHDVAEFDHRAKTYDEGRKGRWNQRVVTRCADVAMASAPVPLRALDVGCGTGGMLVEFSIRLPTAVHVGVDPSQGMADRLGGRAEVVRAGAEALPFPDGTFDLIVCTLSLHHWHNPQRGLDEIARVLNADGIFVLADFAGWWQHGHGGIRHRRKILRLADRAGFELDRREVLSRRLGLPRVQAFVFAR